MWGRVEMQTLDIPTQMAVQELLKEAFAFVGGTSWDSFAKLFNAGAKDKYDVVHLEEMARHKKVRDEHRPKKVISSRFAVRLIEFCAAEKGLIISPELIERLGPMGDPLRANFGPTSTPTISGGFIPALGLTDGVATRSMKRFSGDYLHFSLNEDEKVITARCELKNELGGDGAPVYRSERWYSDFGEVDSVGVYFSWDTNLYLLASPAGEVDLRLSILNVLASSADTQKQPILRGMALGVNPKKTILSSRCILMHGECLSIEMAQLLWDNPMTIESFALVEPGADFAEVNFREIAEYLNGEEAVDYIKLIKLIAPS
jgi:hypothetical protein